MKYLFSFISLFVSLTSLYSCSTNNANTTSASSVKQNNGITIERFDQYFFKCLTDLDSQHIQSDLKSKYPDFLKAFGSVAIDDSETNYPAYFVSLREYFSNTILLQIYKDELKTFEDVSKYEDQLSEANELISKYFEGKKLPRLNMHVSGFKANTIVMQDMISISSDKYLGSDYPVYKQFFEDFQLIQMQPQYLVKDYLKAWIVSELPKSGNRKNLLSEIIAEGKVLYILSQLLPQWSDADLLAYTQSKIDWCKENENKIWKATLQNNYLYSTDYLLINKYLDDAPYSSVVSVGAPPRIGAWIGWQIIKAYCKNTNSSLAQLLAETDAQKILKASKYNP